MNITELLEELDVPFVAEGHEHCRPGWIQVDCPYCSPRSDHYRFGINLAFVYGHCWACGGKDLADALAQIAHAATSAVRRKLGRVERLNAPAASISKRRGGLKIPHDVGPLRRKHKQFLESRKLDWRELRDVWGVRGIGPNGSRRYKWRLYIPITAGGEVVSFTTRHLGESHDYRYMTASPEEESVPNKEVLFGADLAKGAISVHEGPLDAFAVGPGGTATCGLGYTRAQLLAMARYPRRLICFDAEPEAQRRARILCADLMTLGGETINVELETGKDPSRAAKWELKELRRMLRG